MSRFYKGGEVPASRHPHILYWFWNPENIKNDTYLRDLDRVAAESPFTMIIMTARDGIDFWKPEMRPLFERAVAHAHKLGLKIAIQLWPQGFLTPTLEPVPLEKAFAFLNEGECFVRGGEAILRDDTHNVNKAEIAPVIHTELIRAYAFRKASDGVYYDGQQIFASETAEDIVLM